MEKLLTVVGATVLVAFLVFFAAIMGAALGAFGGWCCQFVFARTCARLYELTGFQAYQLGAIVGFVGGCVRSSASSKKD